DPGQRIVRSLEPLGRFGRGRCLRLCRYRSAFLFHIVILLLERLMQDKWIGRCSFSLLSRRLRPPLTYSPRRREYLSDAAGYSPIFDAETIASLRAVLFRARRKVVSNQPCFRPDG